MFNSAFSIRRRIVHIFAKLLLLGFNLTILPSDKKQKTSFKRLLKSIITKTSQDLC